MGDNRRIGYSEELILKGAMERAAMASRTLATATLIEPLEREQLRNYIDVGKRAEQRIVESHLRLVVSIARRYQGAGISLCDLVQDGSLGLITAVEKSDPNKGFRFSTYATWWIRHAIVRGIANHSRAIRLPAHVHGQLSHLRRARSRLQAESAIAPTPADLAEVLDLSLSAVEDLLLLQTELLSLNAAPVDGDDTPLADLVNDITEQLPEEVALAGLFRFAIEEMLCSLKPRERTVLRQRFGFDGGECRTLQEVSQELGISAERVRQIEQRALESLRRRPWVDGWPAALDQSSRLSTPRREPRTYRQSLCLLTKREKEVIDQLAAGHPNSSIGHNLSICSATVAVHLRNIFKKLAVSDRQSAVNVAREEGILAECSA